MNDQNTSTNLIDFVGSISMHVSGNAAFDRFKRTYERDRVAFVYDCLPSLSKTITFYQLEILGKFDSGITRVCVRGPHGLGKTTTASILVHHSVLATLTDTKALTTASVWRQLEDYLWPEIRKTSSMLDWTKIGRDPYDLRTELMTLRLRVQKEPPIEAVAIASDDHQTLEGAHATRLTFIFDESKAIPEKTWDAIEGAFSTEGLSTNEVSVLAISTPGEPTGRFYDIHSRKAGYLDWDVMHVTVDDAIKAGRISEQWVENRRKQWGETSPTFKNRVLGEFAERPESSMIPYTYVMEAVQRGERWASAGRHYPDLKTIAGLDTAREGGNATAIAKTIGPITTNIMTWPKTKATETANKVIQYCPNDIVNIEMEGGYGSSVFDILQEKGFKGARKVSVSAKTRKKDKTNTFSFLNVRAAMWWQAREDFDPIYGVGIILPPDLPHLDQLIQELVIPKWGEQEASGKIYLESRESIVNRLGGKSVDIATAYVLSRWNASYGGGTVI